MRIDFHTHIFAEAVRERAIASLAAASGYEPSFDGSPRGLVAYMDACGTDLSVTFGVATKPGHPKVINSWLAELGEPRLIPLAALFPEADDTLQVLEEAAEKGFKGVKLHPEYQSFDPLDRKLDPMYSLLSELGLIVVFHSGEDVAYPGSLRCTPAKVRTLAERYSGASFVAAHFGGIGCLDECMTLRGRDNFYIDTSLSRLTERETARRLLSSFPEDNILFATDSPWGRAGEDAARIEALGLADGRLEKLMYKNAQRLLGL